MERDFLDQMKAQTAAIAIIKAMISNGKVSPKISET
jgi:hypothetical protein